MWWGWIHERWTEADGTAIGPWADLGWETPRVCKKCKSRGVDSLFPRVSLVSGDERVGSGSNWSKSPNDLVLNGFNKSICDSWRAERFSGAELALRGGLKIVEDCILGDFLRILSGLSTISGGSGSGWALVWILLGATMFMWLDPIRTRKIQPDMAIFRRLTDLFSQFESCSLLTEFEWFYNDKGSSQWSLKVFSWWWSLQVEGSESFHRSTLSTSVFEEHSFSGISQNITKSNQRLTGRAFTRDVTPKRGWDPEAT